MANEVNKNPQDKLNAAKRIAEKSKTNSFFESVQEVIVRFFRWTSSIIDKIFFTKNYAIVFALLLSILTYFIVNIDDDSFSSCN